MPLPPKPQAGKTFGIDVTTDWIATPDHGGFANPIQQLVGDPKPVLTTATKHDQGKTQWHLLPWDSVEEIVRVMEFGAGKYNPFNWMENGGFKYSRIFNSSMRHFIAWFWHREDLDPETGLSHLAHLGCNVLFLLHYVLNKEKYATNDDRR